MLLSKKLLHLSNFIKKQKTIKPFLLSLVFYNLKTKNYLFIIYLNNFKYFLKKKHSPSFLMVFKINVLNNIFFNRILFKIFHLIKSINLIFFFKFSVLNSNKETYTILRAPFVHKKSKEQFFFKNFLGFFTLSLKKTNIFIIDYLENI